MANTKQYDVVISGGGLVGASLASALSDLPLKIALIEAIPPDNTAESSFDERSIALSRTSKTILSVLGVWGAVADEAWPIDEIHVSEKGRFGTALLNAEQQGVDHLGHVVKSRVLGRGLWSVLNSCSSVDVFCPARAGKITYVESGVHVELEGAETDSLNATLLVIADGARSAARDQLGVGADNKCYEQTAIIGNIEVDRRYAGHAAYERFTGNGPLAILPGADGIYTFVLTRSVDDTKPTLELNDEQMLALLQQEFGYRLGNFSRIGERFAYPLYLTTTESLTAQNAVIIGNAAHGLHPVAGQGFNLGLRDAASLAETIAAGLSGDAVFATVLESIQQDYASWRKNDQKNVVRFTDGLIEAFAIDAPLVGTARGLALQAFDALPAAKRGLARYAMGQGGRMSRLARGMKP